MIIYCSPRSGKTELCKKNPTWIDSDIILFDKLNKKFNCTITDDITKGNQIIELFKLDRDKAESVYTDFMYWLKENKNRKNILLGTRRFMWLADVVFIKDGNESISVNELLSAKKWNISYTKLKKNQYISEKLIKMY